MNELLHQILLLYFDIILILWLESIDDEKTSLLSWIVEQTRWIKNWLFNETQFSACTINDL